MCEKRTRKIKKGSHLARMRESRRLQRLQWMSSPTTSDESSSTLTPSSQCPEQARKEVEKRLQNKVLLELAWKTVALMQKNKLIQQKIVALQKETSEFVASIMNNPDNQRRYIEHMKLYSVPQQARKQQSENANNALKIESNMF